MARPERNNVDYFPHSVSHGKKMHFLREKYNNDGYAVWFMLLEELGKADYHYLNLSDNIQLMYLSSQFKISESCLKDIINDLVKMGDFDRELWESNLIIYNQKFVDSIEDAYSKRRNNCVCKNTLLLRLEGLGVIKQSKSPRKPSKRSLKGSINPQSKVEDSKVEDIGKSNKFIKPNFEDLQSYCLERKNGIDPQAFLDKYESNGWKVGKSLAPMKDWKATVRNWERMGKPQIPPQDSKAKALEEKELKRRAEQQKRVDEFKAEGTMSPEESKNMLNDYKNKINNN